MKKIIKKLGAFALAVTFVLPPLLPSATMVVTAAVIADEGVVNQTSVSDYIHFKGIDNNTVKVGSVISAPNSVKVGKIGKLTAKISSANTAKVSWKKVSGASGYEVDYRASAKDKFTMIKDVKKISYTHKKLAYNTTANYRVRAYQTTASGKVYGSYSKTVKIKVLPLAPRFANARTGKSGQAVLSWKKVNAIDGYAIYQSTKKSTKFKIAAIITAKQQSFTVKKLMKGKRYFFKIKSFKKVNGKKIFSPYTRTRQLKITR
jgi:fibronectin type 3 domain-containing protein